MDLMTQAVDADWNKENTGGLDLLLKAAQKTATTTVVPKVPGQKKSRAPTMALNSSYDTPVIVGRGSQATLNLGRVNKQVSRRHAIVQWSPEVGAFQITVLGQNGVRINGTGYPSGQQTTLRGGDIVDLVGVKMLFKTPAGPSPQEVDGTQDHHHQEASPLGLSTPQRSHDKYRHGVEPQQLLTPTKSSPMRDPFGSPAGMVTPTARMRHKTLKYDMTSTTRTLFNSPPPSSDAGTEFGSSPIRPRPVFDRLHDVAPAGYGEDFDAAPDSPRSEASIFWSSPSTPEKNAAATLTTPAPRAPLGSLSLNSNSRINVAASTQFSAKGPSPLASPSSSPAPKPKATTPVVPKVHKVVLSPLPSNANTNNTDIPAPKQKVIKVHSNNKSEDSENLPAKTLNNHSQKEKSTKSTKSSSQTAAVESKRPMTPLKTVNVNVDSNKLKEEKSEKTEKLSKKTTTATSTIKSSPATTKATAPIAKSTARTDSANTTISLEKLHKELVPKLEAVAETKAAPKVVAAPVVKEVVSVAPVVVKAKTVPEVKSVESDIYSSSSSRESSPEPSMKKSTMDYTEMIIDTLVFARKKKSMTLTELFDEMITSQPNILESQDMDEIKEQMLQSLTAARCVGKITRKGKDAYNKPLENQWYYIPECDHNLMRKQTRQEVMPSARKCTLKDKQYFFKMPPKLPYHRKSASPYAVKPTASARRGKESSKLSADVGEPSSSSDDPDEEPEESVTEARKRKSAVARQADKKRKGTGAAPTAIVASAVQSADEEDDDDEVPHDSLDDLSDISGLSD
ncbi:hypothetical protein EMPS_02152 [Entomortierella parvispora]|uniref:FHA domain-containing protein n=1 Tax=Entomortierella parvispora TaxID=205924 RepID=A0A9P3LT98_9FUNG|nr:hypothetical protein EMPS_02152 [Entomortierella parvispora]